VTDRSRVPDLELPVFLGVIDPGLFPALNESFVFFHQLKQLLEKEWRAIFNNFNDTPD
jgi:hypothetical protein